VGRHDDAIAKRQRDRREWRNLESSWRSQHDNRRGTKRKFADIDDTTSIPVSTINQELLRFALNQCQERLSRREVYDIVQKSDGTVADVLIWLKARMSDYIVVQPSEQPNPFSALTLSSGSSSTNSSGSSSTNPFELLSDTVDEEEDDVSSNDNYVSFIFAFCLYSHYVLHLSNMLKHIIFILITPLLFLLLFQHCATECWGYGRV